MSQIVGVIGGGQLARMMIPAAVNLGIDLRVLAEGEGSAARLAATTIGDYRDLATVLAFADTVDVITFDHEHVPQEILHELISRGIAVHPGPDALLFAQDKLRMRQRLTELGLPVPEWARVANPAELKDFLEAHGGRAVVKTVVGGYDGKGVRVVTDAAQVSDWFGAVPATEEALRDDRSAVSSGNVDVSGNRRASGGGDVTGSGRATGSGNVLLVEEVVEFRRELAQLVARRPSGEIVAWPVVESIQRDGVCAEVIAPAPSSAGKLADVAAEIAIAIAEALDVTGVLAVELFETTDERLLVNELAMRPHNTGHWTIDGSTTSQFEQHLRAVLDLPLGATGCRDTWSVMVNILGGPASGALADRYPPAFSDQPTVKIHNYGKEPRSGRKIGHVTAGGGDLDQVVYQARATAAHFGD